MVASLRKAFSRFSSDYGMLFVLLLLCAIFSVLTYSEQNPTGQSAGLQLGKAITLQSHNSVAILAGGSEGDDQFVDALIDYLLQADVEIAACVQGEPFEMRQILEHLESQGKTVDVIACEAPVRQYRFVQDQARRFPGLSATVMTPDSYAWPVFLMPSNIRAIANRIAVIAIIAIGMTMVIITAGIDLSVGSLIALSSVVAAWLIREVGGGPQASNLAMVVFCLAGVAVSASAGAFTGVMVAFFRLPAFIVTLAMMLIASGLAFILSQSQSIYQLPDRFMRFGQGLVYGIPIPVLLMLVLYAAAHLLMAHTTFGRSVYAVGGNLEVARLSGVPVRRVLILCYIISGALAGVGGVIRASELKGGDPNYGLMAELEVIAAVVVGGASLAGGEGRILSTLIGALIIGVIRNGMNLMNIESNAQKVVLGLVIMGAVLLDTLKKSNWRVGV